MNAAEADNKAALRAMVAELVDHYGTLTAAARIVGVSRQALANWQNHADMARGAHLLALQRALAQVRVARNPPVVTHTFRAPNRPQQGVAIIAQSTQAELQSVASPVGAHAMATIARLVAAGQAPPYVLELEICLYYHRDDVTAGVIGQGVIGLARDGAFEADGCAGWSSKRWWVELQARDRQIRSQYRLRVPSRPGPDDPPPKPDDDSGDDN